MAVDSYFFYVKWSEVPTLVMDKIRCDPDFFASIGVDIDSDIEEKRSVYKFYLNPNIEYEFEFKYYFDWLIVIEPPFTLKKFKNINIITSYYNCNKLLFTSEEQICFEKFQNLTYDYFSILEFSDFEFDDFSEELFNELQNLEAPLTYMSPKMVKESLRLFNKYNFLEKLKDGPNIPAYMIKGIPNGFKDIKIYIELWVELLKLQPSEEFGLIHYVSI